MRCKVKTNIRWMWEGFLVGLWVLVVDGETGFGLICGLGGGSGRVYGVFVLVGNCGSFLVGLGGGGGRVFCMLEKIIRI